MIGVDEVGRGAWAGPLLVCAARLKPEKKHVVGLTDSKQLSRRKRQELAKKIVENYDIGEGWVSAEIIDDIGLTKALKCACLLAVTRITSIPAEKILLDGNYNFFSGTIYTNVEVMKKADLHIAEVSAASIFAKVLRDSLMAEYDTDYSEYNFAKNVGYGTNAHSKALEKYGLTRLHRKSFKPVKLLV